MRRGKRSSLLKRKREPRTNERIRSPKLRVIIEGQSPTLMNREEALQLAKSLGLDLVEVSATQEPPVCRIIDYGKYRFEQKKRKRQQARSQQVSIKEIKIRPKIALHDYDLKRRNAFAFLQNGDKVKVTVRFRGREIAHPELGMQLMERLLEDLKAVSVVEAPARKDGRQINMVIAPRPGLKQSKAEKSSSEDPAAEIQGRAEQGSREQERADSDSREREI